MAKEKFGGDSFGKELLVAGFRKPLVDAGCSVFEAETPKDGALNAVEG